MESQSAFPKKAWQQFSDITINMAPPLHKLLVCQLHEKFCSLYLNVQEWDPHIPSSLYYFNSFSLSLTRLTVTDIPQMTQNGFENQSRFFKIV